MRRTLLPLLALTLVTGLACSLDQGDAQPESSRELGTSPRPDPSADVVDDQKTGDPAPAKTTAKPAPAKVKPLTCQQLEIASLGSAARPYNGYADPIPLVDGMWAGEDGVVVQLQAPCAIGELTGDDAADAVVPVLMDGGGTGKFWQLAMFRNVDAKPSYVTMVDIGDRTPIEKVTVSAGQAYVEFLMRPEDPSSSVDLIRRTATYRLDGNDLMEIGYVDAPA